MPSGTFIYHVTETDTVTVDGAVVFQDATSYKTQSTETPRTAEHHTTSTESTTVFGVTYCATARDHFVNGQYQYSDTSFGC